MWRLFYHNLFLSWENPKIYACFSLQLCSSSSTANFYPNFRLDFKSISDSIPLMYGHVVLIDKPRATSKTSMTRLKPCRSDYKILLSYLNIPNFVFIKTSNTSLRRLDALHPEVRACDAQRPRLGEARAILQTRRTDLLIWIMLCFKFFSFFLGPWTGKSESRSPLELCPPPGPGLD